jgi:hypothetical protein
MDKHFIGFVGLTAENIQTAIFSHDTMQPGKGRLTFQRNLQPPSSIGYPRDRGSGFLQNNGNHLQLKIKILVNISFLHESVLFHKYTNTVL